MELKDREVGLFARKIYTGHIFAANAKPFDEFFTEAEVKLKKKLDGEELEKFTEQAKKDYMDYLDGERQKEYVYMREPSSDESTLLQGNEVSSEILEKLPPETQLKRAEETVARDRERQKQLMALVIDCIVGSSFTIDGKQAPLEKVREIYKQSTTAMAYITGEWMEGMANFQKRSARASKG